MMDAAYHPVNVNLDTPNPHDDVHVQPLFLSPLDRTNPGWWYTYPSEKYARQLGFLFPIYGKIKFMFQSTNQNL